MNGKTVLLLLIFIIKSYSYNADQIPHGHLKRMGSHRPSEAIKEVNGWPNPRDFYYQHVLVGKPLIIRDGVKDWPALKKWNDKYLREKAGHQTVTMELAKKENRQGEKRVKLSHFLDIYQLPENKNMGYVIESVPKSMRDDLGFPKEWKKVMHEATEPTMWFSSGGTNSVLHRDHQDNFNCIIDGRKEFVMINKVYWKETYESDKYAGYGSRCPFDTDAVDLIKWPLFRFVRWSNVSVSTGDCLFIPYSWYHQVRSYDRNLAINMWFMPPKRNVDIQWSKDQGSLGSFVPFSNQSLWKFSSLDGGGDLDGSAAERYELAEAKRSVELEFDDNFSTIDVDSWNDDDGWDDDISTQATNIDVKDDVGKSKTNLDKAKKNNFEDDWESFHNELFTYIVKQKSFKMLCKTFYNTSQIPTNLQH